MHGITALLAALGSIVEPGIDTCEAEARAAYHAVDLREDFGGLYADQGEADGMYEDTLAQCHAERAQADLGDYLRSIGGFGATTFGRAIELGAGCGTPVVYVERVSADGWVAVCADIDGRPVSFRGAL